MGENWLKFGNENNGEERELTWWYETVGVLSTFSWFLLLNS